MKDHLNKLAQSLSRGKFHTTSLSSHKLSMEILPQPDETTCGPTCLQAVYGYYGDEISLEEVIKTSKSFKEGGTLAAWLGCHALERGYQATIYTYDLQTFDPTWFSDPKVDIRRKLIEQLVYKKDDKLRKVTEAYSNFLQMGGKLEFEDLTRDLLRGFLKRNIPIISGLNSSFLYRVEREIQDTMVKDDIRGESTGHFVVLRGYQRENKTIYIADPYAPNPYASHKYKVPIDRVICAILLGNLTYDANFLIIQPS